MQKTRVMVAGTAILLSFIATTPQAAAGWQETEWGMTQDEVQNAVPDVTPNDDRGKDALELRAELRSNYESSGINFEVSFLFASDQKLMRVDLTPLSDADCPKLERLIHAAYGTPEAEDKMELISNTKWRDAANSNLLSLVRLNQGICSLTYQAMPTVGATGGL
ncbi:hypothetical protein PANO111632_21155 [Paracoccus nototheniae]|uniref:Uncharacterized protein n=2 Tax=Paracoccus TaxID=265 RepID=A0ABW4E4W4_9RHOB|nr:hypothetical protein [Paracoccus nototheniae]